MSIFNLTGTKLYGVGKVISNPRSIHSMSIAIKGSATVKAKQVKVVTPGKASVKGSGKLQLLGFVNLKKASAKLEGKGTVRQIGDFTRLREVNNQTLYDGLGLVTVESQAWKYKTVRGTLDGVATMNAFLYERDIMKDVKESVPKYYDDSLHVQGVLGAEANESIRLNAQILNVLDQFYPSTATWGLALWEEQFAIETDETLSYETRRERIIERITGKYIVTFNDLVNEANKYWDIDVVQNIRELSVTLTIKQRQVVESLNPIKFKQFMERMNAFIPSHIDFKLKFYSVDWQEMKDAYVSWDDIKGMSWNAVKTQYYSAPYKFEEPKDFGDLSNYKWGDLEPEPWVNVQTTTKDPGLYPDLAEFTWGEIEEKTWNDIDTRITNEWEVKI